MVYHKEVTNLIVYYWGKGLTAEETQKALIKNINKKVSIPTIYRHRHNLTAQQIIDQLFTDQRRDISMAELETRLKYRDSILRTLIPQRIESKIESKHEEKVVNINATTDEDQILSQAARILTRKRKSHQVH